MVLTVREKIYIVQCYGIGVENSLREVVSQFNLKFPNTALSRTQAMRIIKKFLATGSVLNMKRKRKAYDEDNVGAIIAHDSVTENPRMPLRQRSAIINISKSELQRIYKAKKIRAYKANFKHTLEEGDDGRRLDFCLTIGEKIMEERFFHHFIIFSDESTFTTNGVVSSQNCRYWASENPNFRIHSRRQYYKKVNVWCAVSYHVGVIGPYFIEGRLNQHTYLQLLERFSEEHLNILRDMPLVHFQHDGCPSHSTEMVNQWLNLNFGENWIARNGPIKWPPRSPDLSILDFFLWGRLKQLVYAEPLPNDVAVLKQRITNAVNSIPLDHIRNSFRDFRRRIERCVDMGGSYIE